MSEVMRRWPPGLPIGDGWVATPTTVSIRFPYDGTPVADAPEGSIEEAKIALQAAEDVADTVAGLPSRTRRAVLLAAHDALADLREDFEQLLVLETGKPLKDCRVEVTRTLVTLTAAAEEVARIHGETVPMDLLPSGDGLLGFWTRVPIGVVVGIAGFNYPLLLATHKVGSALVSDRRVGAVSFTGSSAVGHRIARDAAPTKVLLELGSNAALIVAPDADLDRAADAVIRGGYYASGQACISVQRVIVAQPVFDKFLDRVATRLENVVVGDPRRADTDVSALIDDRSTERVEEWVAAAMAAGARVVAGGGRDGTLLRPVVLADVPDGVDVWDDEVFGPVVCIRAVPDVELAFDVANRSRYGLHASVWTTSLRTAFRAVQRLDVGGGIINEVPGFRSDTMPYGGVKSSGSGREGPRFAIDELTVTKMAVIRWE